MTLHYTTVYFITYYTVCHYITLFDTTLYFITYYTVWHYITLYDTIIRHGIIVIDNSNINSKECMFLGNSNRNR